MSQDIRTFDTVVIRTPSLPLQQAYDANIDAQALFGKFRTSSLFREAIFLASPELCSEVLKYLGKGAANPKDEDKMVLALLKYHNRMATRCTPFGLFAGCATATIGSNTSLRIMDAEAGSGHLRFDMHFLCKLTDHLAQQPELKQLLHYYPNTGIYTSGDKLRYYEKYYTGKIRQHKISDVDHSEYLDNLLSTASNGASFATLVECLVSEDITAEEAGDFVTEVIGSHLLITELEPAATGKDTLEKLIETLEAIGLREGADANNFLAGTLQKLRYLREQLAAIHQPGDPENITACKNIIERIKEWGYDAEEKYLFQSDLSKAVSAGATLGENLIQKIEAGIKVLANYSKKGSNPVLAEFKTKFTERYEDAWVPLLEVIDNETGLGYPAWANGGNVPEYLAELVPGGGGAPGAAALSLADADIPLVKKIIDAQRNGDYEIVLDDALPATAVDTSLFLSTFSVMASILDDPATANARIHFTHAGNNASAAMLQARFCHTDPAIEKLVKDITAKEQELRPGVVYAEIVHLPESRVGNVLLRPVIRAYEIPFLAQSGLPKEQQLPPEDLMVTVRKGRILLYSRKLDKEIIPKLTNAHNFNMKPMPLYQFLCALQYEQQDTTGVMFALPPIVNSLFVFKPRVSWQNIIFKEASWSFSKKETDELVKGDITLTEWRAKWNMPLHIIIADGDNELFLNLGNELNCRLLLAELKKRSFVEIKEMLFLPGNGGLPGNNGSRYANELVISWHKTTITEEKEQQFSLQTPGIKRQFIPGEEWLYYKLYCGNRSADLLLASVIHPVTGHLLQNGIITSWFFIRYTDPLPHIRFRMRLKDPVTGIAPAMQLVMKSIEPYTRSGQVNKIVIDTYTRETERYGEATIALAEDFFCADSRLITAAIIALLTEDNELLRWKLALLCTDQLLLQFGYDNAGKEKIVKKHLAGFLTEFGVTQKRVQSLEDTYRKHKKEIEALMQGDDTSTPGMEILRHILQARAEQMSPIATAIIVANKAIGKDADTEEMLWSLIHMMINRIFRSQQRRNEMACYYLLNNYYTSLNIRTRKQQEKLPQKEKAAKVSG